MSYSATPEFAANFDQLLDWLHKKNFTQNGSILDLDINHESHHPSIIIPEVLGKGIHRRAITRKSKAEREAIQQRQPNSEEVSKSKLWQAQKNPRTAVRHLDRESIPIDALAFYRAFHYTPHDQWGIYLHADKILQHHQHIYHQSRNQLLWDFDTLLHLMIFEIFNHEFFHHLVESTVTYLEIISASWDRPYPIFRDYKGRQHSNRIHHPHHPLEEALANAYAYNALSFISRIKAGFKTATIKVYQEAIKKHWAFAPQGYCKAQYYIQGKHVLGSAALLEQIMDIPGAANDIPLSIMAKHLMPNGYSALFAKPDIPTYLIGSKAAIEKIESIVPAMNETYTQLFWPKDSKAFDQYIQRKLKEEKSKKTNKIAMKH